MPPVMPMFTKTFHTEVYPSIHPDNLSANGKTVLITGGGRGIGKSIAWAFARAKARTVIILGRTKSTLEQAAPEIEAVATGVGHEVNVRYFTADIADADAVSAVFKTIKDEHTNIDVVVNNAGALHLGTIDASDIAAYSSSLDTNIKGTLNVMKAFLDFGLDRNAASPATFINLSTAGIGMPHFPTWSQYVVSKLAAFTLTSFFGVEAGGKVRAFSIHPGRIATDMSSQAGIETFDDEDLPGGFCVWLSATPEADFLQQRLLMCNWDVDELLQMKDEIVEKGLLKMKFEGIDMKL